MPTPGPVDFLLGEAELEIGILLACFRPATVLQSEWAGLAEGSVKASNVAGSAAGFHHHFLSIRARDGNWFAFLGGGEVKLRQAQFVSGRRLAPDAGLDQLDLLLVQLLICRWAAIGAISVQAFNPGAFLQVWQGFG